MAVAGVLVFEDGPGLAPAALDERLTSRLHLIPRYRQRLQDPPVGLLGNPVWVDDDTFDLHWHVRRTTLPARMPPALVDGAAALDVGTVLLAPTPEPMEIPAPDEPWKPRSYDRR